MITRRRLVIAGSVGLALAAKDVKAESAQIPTIEEVGQIVKDPQEYERAVANFELVALALVLGLWDKHGPPTPKDRELLSATGIRFLQTDFVHEIISGLPAPEAAQLVDAAVAKAQPVAQRIKMFLNGQGVVDRANRDGVRSFYLFVQFKAVAETKVEPWYCDVYPFSYFCKSG